MPEGDTVWLAGRTLHDALAGSSLTACDFRVPGLATLDLTGRRVERVSSYGKHLFFAFDDHHILHTHFRMDGSWHLYSRGVRWKGGPAWQIRAVLSTSAVDAVGYRLPVVEVMDTQRHTALINSLGPDLIVDDVDWARAIAQVRGQPEQRPIGETLLDQRVVAGLGLIYVTESLFVHGVTPWTSVGDVTDVPGLLAEASRLMRANRHHYIQTTTGDTHPDRWHWVFERAGQACRRCATTIRIAWQCRPPRQRLAYWCPTCQTGPGATPLTGAQRRSLRTAGRSRYRP